MEHYKYVFMFYVSVRMMLRILLFPGRQFTNRLVNMTMNYRQFVYNNFFSVEIF